MINCHKSFDKKKYSQNHLNIEVNLGNQNPPLNIGTASSIDNMYQHWHFYRKVNKEAWGCGWFTNPTSQITVYHLHFT